jgi:MATE family multidrug resistance protein
MKTYKNDITAIFSIALPLVAALLSQRGMQFIDTVMMGWLGPPALAAGTLAGAIYITILLFAMGILSAVGIFIVRGKAFNDSLAVNLNLQHGIYLALLLSIPCMLIIWFMPYALSYLGEDALVIKDTISLLHSLMWGIPGELLFLVMRELLSAFSLTLIVMVISLISIPLTFLANYILIYGKFHFPALGIAGIGYGGSAVMWFMFLGLLFYSKQHRLIKDYMIVKQYKFDRVVLSDMLRLGVPSGILLLLEAGMFLVTVLIMGHFGVAALAAHQIALLCVNVAYMLPLGLAMAGALQVGHAYASKNLVQVKRTALLSFGIVLIISASFALIFTFCSNFLVNLFLEKNSSQAPAVHQLAISFIHIAVFFLCFDALQSVASGVLRGLKDTFVPMLLSIVCYWVLGVGGAYYLSMYTSLGARGVWFGLSIGLASTAIVLILRFFKKLRWG